MTNTLPADLADRVELARAAAMAAGGAALRRFRSGRFNVESKGDATPVTEADREAESEVRRIIRAAFPDDTILGEEHADEHGSSACRWIIDPIDGTLSFIRGVPLWGTLIAMETVNEDGTVNPPCLGVIHMPALGETVYAATGQGAWHVAPGHIEAVPARVSSVTTMDEALASITAYSYFRDAGHAALYSALLNDFRHSRGWSDCYAHLLVATGRADACIEPTLAVWDIAATYPILKEAGGVCTSWSGASDPRSNNALIANAALHGPLLERLRRGTGS